MKKYIIYSHDGSGNHGCEALVRTTTMLLDASPDQIFLVSERPEEDCHYGIDKLCRVFQRGKGAAVNRASLEFLKAYWQLKVHKDYWLIDAHCFLNAIDAQKGDVALSIGGDTYCYGFTGRLAKEHAMYQSRKLKTVYWGCSIEPELLKDNAIAKDIASYDLVTARETISYEALKKVNPNTILVADSAFLLEKVELLLPDGFDNCDLVCINSSPLIENSESVPGIARQNYQHLIEYILETTTMKILLLPHVIWPAVDDRTVLRELYNQNAESGRIYLLSDHNCKELKGYISRCRFMIGARTHATIAAYSSGVPTLVVGYSIKAKGIATDLFGTDEHYVLPVQNLTHPDDLTAGFQWLMTNEQTIRQTLAEVIPSYTQRIYRGVEALNKL